MWLRNSYLLTAVIACGFVSNDHAGAVSITENGQARAKIYLPAQTELQKLIASTPDKAKALQALGDDEVLAAEELQSIIARISGATLPVERVEQLPPANQPAIILGTELAKRADLGKEMAQVSRDGLLLATRNNHLYLTGSRARGTLYAAYELLEEWGCRWVLPGPFGEIYPALPTLQATFNKVENPSHTQRYWWCTYGEAPGYARWTLRNKGNYVLGVGDQRVAQGHALSQPLQWAARQEKYRVRRVKKVLQPKKDAAGQPVLGADGKPVQEEVENEVWEVDPQHQSQLNGEPNMGNPNFSNPATWDLYAEYYIQYFNNNPDVQYVSISAEDGLVLDERPASRALDNNEWDWTMGAPSATDKLWFFHNRVIEKVTKFHPQKKFGVLVYANNMMPPRLELVHPNMALVFAPLGVCPLHHIRDEKCKTNRAYVHWFDDWMRLAEASGAETHYYDYEPTGYCWNMALICPRWGIIAKNYPYFKSKGLDGHTTQGHDDWASSGINNYLMQRLYWDVTQDPRAILTDYCKARFGAAAPLMLRYLDVLEQRMNEIPDLYSNEVWANHLVLTPEVRKRAGTLLHQAAAMTLPEVHRAHVQTMVDLQRSTDAMCDAIEYADATGDFGRAAAMMEPVFEIRDKLNKLYPNFMNASRVDPKSTPEYLTGGIYNQYKKFAVKSNSAAARLILPRYWKGMLDRSNEAWARGYHLPRADVKSLADQDVTVMPDVRYRTQREPAAFFYRTEADVPVTFRDKKVFLWFPSIIARGLQIWINGQPVMFKQGAYEERTWRGPSYFWIDYNHEQEFEITPLIKPGERNTIAFRAFKSFDFGGTYRRIGLLGR